MGRNHDVQVTAGSRRILSSCDRDETIKLTRESPWIYIIIRVVAILSTLIWKSRAMPTDIRAAKRNRELLVCAARCADERSKVGPEVMQLY